jgi:AcrR family transcriptional regulator
VVPRGKPRTPGNETADKVIQAAADLLRSGGVEAVSTRAVAAAAGVQPPIIYRQFGDKQRLLDAVTRFVLQDYLQDKRRAIRADNPVQDLRESWDLHVGFGLTHPDCYLLAYVQPRPGTMPPPARETVDVLRALVARIGDHGQLRMSVNRATELLHVAAVGFVVSQIRVPPDKRDPQLSRIVREHAISAVITGDSTQPSLSSDLSARAVALREALRGDSDGALTSAERALLAEWLNRLADRAEVIENA